jgi:hypothetical protein
LLVSITAPSATDRQPVIFVLGAIVEYNATRNGLAKELRSRIDLARTSFSSWCLHFWDPKKLMFELVMRCCLLRFL